MQQKLSWLPKAQKLSMKMNMNTKTAIKSKDEICAEPEAINIAQVCAEAASDKKASHISILDVARLTTFTDVIVVCSAPSERQVQAIIRNVEDALLQQGVKPLGIEGLETSSWVLMDLGNVIFHCFTDSAREYYDLEGFWIDAKKIDF